MFTIPKKKSLLIIFVMMVNYSFASEWVDLGAPEPLEPSCEVNAISSSNLEISFKLKGFLQDHLKNGLNLSLIHI